MAESGETKVLTTREKILVDGERDWVKRVCRAAHQFCHTACRGHRVGGCFGT